MTLGKQCDIFSVCKIVQSQSWLVRRPPFVLLSVSKHSPQKLGSIEETHNVKSTIAGWLALVVFIGAIATPATAQQKKRTPAPAPASAQPAAPAPVKAQDTGKPNIIIIWGDDIGQSNISAYTNGLMGYRTPNIDSIAQGGMIFTDYYGEQSCTAGRSAFITGQSVFRTGLSKVGIPGSAIGLSKEDPTIAELLKAQGYATGQFGKNHLGDKDEFLPPRMVSMNSMAIFITSMPRKSRNFPII